MVVAAAVNYVTDTSDVWCKIYFKDVLIYLYELS